MRKTLRIILVETAKRVVAVGLVLTIENGTETDDESELNERAGKRPVIGEFDSRGAAETTAVGKGELFMSQVAV